MGTSRLKQIGIYVGKLFRLFVSERKWTNFISTAIIMIIISMVTSEDMFITYKDTKNGAFAIICACIWVGLFNSIQSICRERDIIKREHRTGLHISSYVLAHVIYEFAVCLAETLIVALAVFIKNIDNIPERALIFSVGLDMYFTFLFTIFSADMIAVLVSSIVKNQNSAMTVMPFVLIIQLVMSGAVFELSGISEKIANFTISKWGLNGIVSSANKVDSVKMQYDLIEGTGCDPTGENLLKIWGILILFSLIYVIISILVLEGIDRDKR